MAYKKNPFETIISLGKKQSRALEHLLNTVSEENAIEGLKKIRRQLKKEKNKKNKPSYAATRIQKLLRDYPGFEKEVLKTFNARIREAKKLGTLHTYMSEEKKAAEIRKAARKKIKEKAKGAKAVKATSPSQDNAPFKPYNEDFDSKTLKVELDAFESEEKNETSLKTNNEVREKLTDKSSVESEEISRLNIEDEEPDFDALKDVLDNLEPEERIENSLKSNVEVKGKMPDKHRIESKNFSRPVFSNEDYDSKTVELNTKENTSKEDNITQSDAATSAKKNNKAEEQRPQKPKQKPKDNTPFFIGDEEFTSRTMEIDMDTLLASPDKED